MLILQGVHPIGGVTASNKGGGKTSLFSRFTHQSRKRHEIRPNYYY